jgi:hypothetical protein
MHAENNFLNAFGELVKKNFISKNVLKNSYTSLPLPGTVLSVVRLSCVRIIFPSM